MEKGVNIKSLKNADAVAMATLANNKKIWDNLRDYIPHPYTLKDAQEFIAASQKENPGLTFGIFFDDEFCGVIGLVQKTDVYRLGCEIGYWVGEPFWGKGIASEALRLVTDYGFENLLLERISTSVFDYNLASMRVLEKNGYQKEGVLRRSVVKNEKVYDEHVYAKLKNE